ncbi:MAG: winged helix-turn-helix domain-containing protein [Janthinobacterium lividum]
MAIDRLGTAYRFDEFSISGHRGTLQNAHGQEVPLRPKALALLQLLLERPGRLAPREELLETLWPNTTVSDDSLTQCVSDLRQAFGPRAPHILRTLPRRGYILCADVEQLDAPAQPRAPRPQTAEPPAGDSERTASIVLVNKTHQHPEPDPGSRHMAETLATDLITELTSFEDLRIVPAQAATANAFRLALDVRRTALLQRASLQLESLNGTVLWAERIEVPHGPAPELDDTQLGRLAINILRQVNREDLRQARALPPARLTPRQLWLLGQDFHRRGTETDTITAIDLLNQAVRLDPSFALAHAALSYAVQRSVTHGWGGMEPELARQQCLSHAQRAVQLEPGSPPCLARLAFALLLQDRWEEAIDTARAAVQSCRRPTWEALAPAGEVLVYAGHAAEAIILLRQILTQDPLCPPTARAVLGRALLLAGHPDQALPELRWCASQLPDYAPCLNSLVVAAAETGRTAEARIALREVRRLESLWPPSTPNGRWLLRHDADRARFQAAFTLAAQASDTGA